ncbi:MAG: glycoside hydrolase family 99-like domain-containing protein, partial [Phascolarctobacterium sp.]|nr:glycoside hydrolase family 99-like domain-containing protein [Candidatus Phascolarctobacterium caballi]
MADKVKVIANYLPQYHRIPENDMWWGEGYTDWVATKNAKPLFEGHRQPRIPLDNNYYDLSDVNTIRWQAQLARKYGVYGFGIYHYWFNSNMQLLQKPAELLLKNKDIDINFMFIWDNSSWIRSWSNIKECNDWAPKFDREQKNTDNG